MKVIHGLDAFDPGLEHCVLTVGNFDGVHVAHQKLLTQAKLLARQTKGPVAVLTFEPHPLTVVAPEKAPRRLSLPEEKLRCLELAGADLVVVARSEPALLGLEADRFVEDVLIELFHPTHMVVGPSFGFGKGRKGTPQLLARLGPKFGCEVQITEPMLLQLDQEAEPRMVSSSLIRNLLLNGRVREAASCLGRSYAVFGEVVRGDGRGRSIGFPTANIALADQLMPGEGVYGGRAIVGDVARPCAISVGHTPTFGGTEERVEAHLLDFDGDLYGQIMRVEFETFVRQQRKFESAAALSKQLCRDVDAVRAASGRPQPQGTGREGRAS